MKQRLLIVEDEVLVAFLLKDYAADAGISDTAIVGTVADALSVIASDPPAFALVDVNLRNETSVTVADALAAAGIPFAFSSGCRLDAIPERHRGAPVLVKPYTAKLMKAMLHQLRERAAALPCAAMVS